MSAGEAAPMWAGARKAKDVQGWGLAGGRRCRHRSASIFMEIVREMLNLIHTEPGALENRRSNQRASSGINAVINKLWRKKPPKR